VLGEPGCLAYDYTRDAEPPQGMRPSVDPDRITLLERWESADALKAHLGTAHMQAAGARMRDLRESVELRVVESVF
jgi:quinol monooxygenase YgiN